MKYTNKHVLTIRDEANNLLMEIGSQNVLFLTISQSYFQIWKRVNDKEIMLAGYSTIDETYRWFEGFKLAMTYNQSRPKSNYIGINNKVSNNKKVNFVNKMIGIFNRI